MSTAAITYQGTKYYSGGWSSSFSTSQNSADVGVKSASVVYSICFKIALPAFTGVSESISFTLPYCMDGSGWDSAVYLHAAVTTAENQSVYGSAYGTLSDPNAVVINQDVTVTGISAQLNEMTVTFPAASFSSGGTYYVYLYGAGDDTSGDFCQMYDFHSGGYDATFSLTYQSGLVHVYSGSGWDNYQAYVYNNGNWNLCIPYVYDGAWEILA